VKEFLFKYLLLKTTAAAITLKLDSQNFISTLAPTIISSLFLSFRFKPPKIAFLCYYFQSKAQSLAIVHTHSSNLLTLNQPKVLPSKFDVLTKSKMNYQHLTKLKITFEQGRNSVRKEKL
jgi:hypothetical protein